MLERQTKLLTQGDLILWQGNLVGVSKAGALVSVCKTF